MRNKKVLVIAIIAVIVLLTGIVTAISVSRTSANSPAQVLSLGERFLLDMDYEQALVQFLHLIEIDPMNPRGYTGAAEAFIGLGRTNEATSVLRTGLNIPGMNYQYALDLFLWILEIDPSNIESYLGAALAYEALGRRDEALDILMRGLDATGAQEIADMIEELLARPEPIPQNDSEQDTVASVPASDSHRIEIPEGIIDLLDRLYAAFDNANHNDAFQVLSDEALIGWLASFEQGTYISHNADTRLSDLPRAQASETFLVYRKGWNLDNLAWEAPSMRITLSAHSEMVLARFGLSEDGSTHIWVYLHQGVSFMWEEMTYQGGNATGDYRRWHYSGWQLREGVLPDEWQLTSGTIVDGAFQGEVTITQFWPHTAEGEPDAHDVLIAHYIDGIAQPLGTGSQGGLIYARNEWQYRELPPDDPEWQVRRPYGFIGLGH